MTRLRPAALGLAATLLAATMLAAPARADQRFPATLAGHAAVPAMSLLAPPADAPADAWVSGKFAGPGNLRNDRPMSVMGTTGALHGNRATGIAFPFIGQPLQGFSGFAMARAADGSFWTITDNGFGSKRNSPDALLFFHRLAPDWRAGRVEVRQTVFLRDPDRVIPFRITNEGTRERYLTGADFDLESIQVVGDTVWIGEEFGPFLIRATLDGRVTGLFETQLDGQALRSPDHPALQVPAAAGRDWRVTRSGGYEGMAVTPDGSRLWAMLEKPILTPEGQAEGSFLRVLEFDTAAARWTGRSVKYALEQGATAIGDFNMIDATRALVIERDDGEGDPSLACAAPNQPRPDCFPNPARFKRVYVIDLAQVDANGFARKLGHIDLMNLADTEGLARIETAANPPLRGRYTVPFFTIENVVRVDEAHIMVAVDNNLPFSSGRRLDRAADNEFFLIRAPELLSAR
jgi:hypothetical protein